MRGLGQRYEARPGFGGGGEFAQRESAAQLIKLIDGTFINLLILFSFLNLINQKKNARCS